MFCSAKKSILAIVCLISLGLHAQDDGIKTIDVKNIPRMAGPADSIKKLPQVVISGFRDESEDQNTMSIVSVNVDSLRRFGNYNLCDLMRKIPGVDMLSTGAAISKPVIRGLYGNRILILLQGLRFDNQQWQEEHGLGLTDMGFSRVEVIKGPFSVLYGSEAVGGVVNIIDEEDAPIGRTQTDAQVKFYSNTLGTNVQAGFKTNNGKNRWRLRVGTQTNGDYSDGTNTRVLNSRFAGYYLKAGYGFSRKNWECNNSLTTTFDKFGFIFNDVYNYITADSRWSRKFDFPSHYVFLNIFNSENKITLKSSVLKVNAGFQSNLRMEKEGSGSFSLMMHLMTFQYAIKWEKPLTETARIVLSHNFSFEDNTNFGSRKIIPDANMQESNFGVYLEKRFKTLTLENGIAVGQRYIKTYPTPTVNLGDDKEVKPFTKFSPFYNALTGLSWRPVEGLNIKLNAATGIRVGNLAELSSDGLHEGVFTYEIGNPNLKNEQNLNGGITITYKNKYFSFTADGFYNHIFNYIYLNPTGEQWVGFPVFRYTQTNARLYGGEVGGTVTIHKRLTVGVTYNGMIGQKTIGGNLPFIPAQKIKPNITWRIPIAKLPFFVSTDGEYAFAQTRTAVGEPGSHQYFVLNASAAIKFGKANSPLDVSVSCNNILNTVYFDNLSRFKYYGLNNIGRNFVFTVKYSFL